MKTLRTHPTTHARTKLAALVAAALVAVSSAGCAEISQSLRDIDNAVLAALGGQPKSAGGSSGEWVEVKERDCGDECNVRTTRLILAAQNGDTAAVERLLASGASINAQEMHKLYVYHEGNESGGLEYIPETGKSALMAAAEKGHLAIVEKLLAAGANVNARCRYEKIGEDLYGVGEGKTALVFALENGQNAAAERLLAAGANVNDGGYGGCVPETDSCGESPYPLEIAAMRGDMNMVNTLLRYKASPNHGLCGAASQGRTEIVKLLLDKGANAKDTLTCAVSGEPYEKGCSNSQTEIVRLLLSRGANPNAKYPEDPEGWGSDRGGMSVLQYAKKRGCTQIAKLLQSAGAGKKGAKKRK